MTSWPAGSPIAEPLWSLELFNSWRLSQADNAHKMQPREQRLVALLALQGSRRRSYLAGILWPDSTEVRAGASLRAATYRIDQIAPGLLLHDRHDMALSADLRVDVHDFIDYVTGISVAGHSITESDNDAATWLPRLVQCDLLPGWYDDWVIHERARLQQLRIQALETIASRMLERGDAAAALVAASAAVAIEPLRESAQRILIRIHMFDGNYQAALHHFREFRTRIRRELGVGPSGQMLALVGPLLLWHGAAGPPGGLHRLTGPPRQVGRACVPTATS